MRPGHADYLVLKRLLDVIHERAGGKEALLVSMPLLIQEAVDFVIDPIRTARTKISDIDNVEKTFIGLKVEHFLRDLLGAPKGIRDLVIDGLDVDVKNTVRKTWMIPPETFSNSEPCLLIMVASEARHCSMGLMLAKEEYLNKPNRDGKRSVKAGAFENLLWLFQALPLPASRFDGLDMARFRELRSMKGGSIRAAQFFRENLGRVVHRSVIQGLLYDQEDYMKRIRSNGGAREILAQEQIAILSGTYFSSQIESMSLPYCGADEFVSTKLERDDWESLVLSGYMSKKA